jgi:hypothetical protein
MLRFAAVAATTDISQRSFLCPCCRKILYALRPGENGMAWEPTRESPGVRHDGTGPFLKCPHCERRIAIVVSPEYADEPFFLAANQTCRHLAPD